MSFITIFCDGSTMIEETNPYKNVWNGMYRSLLGGFVIYELVEYNDNQCLNRTLCYCDECMGIKQDPEQYPNM